MCRWMCPPTRLYRRHRHPRDLGDDSNIFKWWMDENAWDMACCAALGWTLQKMVVKMVTSHIKMGLRNPAELYELLYRFEIVLRKAS
jgi:hypothetical protein